MEVSLCFVPPGGGEIDYCSMDFILPSRPHVGDIIRIEGNEIPPLVVCRIRWELRQRVQGFVTQVPPKASTGYVKRIVVECERAN